MTYSTNSTHGTDPLYSCIFVMSRVIKCTYLTTANCAGRIQVLLLVDFKVSSSEIGWIAFTYLSHIACLCSRADRRRHPAWHTIHHSDTCACTQLQQNTACLKFKVQTFLVNSSPLFFAASSLYEFLISLMPHYTFRSFHLLDFSALINTSWSINQEAPPRYVILPGCW